MASVDHIENWFPNYFWSMNDHMFLIEVSETVYTLMPPNQADWFYTIKKISDTEWNVSGSKTEDPETINYNYEFINNRWLFKMNLIDCCESD
jgi:hypothetical protein